MSDKRQERQTAALLGSWRNPNNGELRTDIDAWPFAVENKTRKSLLACLTGAFDQARRAAGGRTPIVILSEVIRVRKARRYALLALDDWLEWHGPAAANTYSQVIADRTKTVLSADGAEAADAQHGTGDVRNCRTDARPSIDAHDAIALINFAEQAGMYARQSKLGTSAIDHATMIKVRAERRLADIVDKGHERGEFARAGDGS